MDVPLKAETFEAAVEESKKIDVPVAVKAVESSWNDGRVDVYSIYNNEVYLQ